MKNSNRLCLFKAATSPPKQSIKITYRFNSMFLTGPGAAAARPLGQRLSYPSFGHELGLGCLVNVDPHAFNSFSLTAIFPHCYFAITTTKDSHLGPVSPLPSLPTLLPTRDSVTPKWRFEAPSESVSFESAATAERRPLSDTERAETRRHGEGTATSRPLNQLPREERPARRRFLVLGCNWRNLNVYIFAVVFTL